MHRPVPLGRRSRIAAGVALAVVALVVSGCSAAAPAAPATAPATLSGFSTAQVQSLFQEGAAAMHLPGAFLLLDTPEGRFTAAYGTTVLGGHGEPAATTRIRIGSNTKTMTGTVILQLAGEGRIGLDDPVSAYRPEVPGGDRITIRMLLDMRSGLYNYTEDPAFNAAMDADPERAWSPEELLRVGLARPPYFAPDQGYHYSNTNTVLLGLIAEKIEGMPLRDVFQDRLFDPLGMADTLLPSSGDADLPRPLSHGYSFGTNLGTIDRPALDDAGMQSFFDGRLEPDDHTFDNPSWAWAAGGAISTANDLAIWVTALTDGSLLGPQLQRERTTFLKTSPTAPADAPTYGLNLANFAGYQGHTGELPGYNSFVARDPKTGVTLVVWANLAPTGDGKDPATAIARSILQAAP